MNIIKATVILTRHCMDIVVLQTDDKPSPAPSVATEPLALMFHAAYDTGKEYVEKNFPNIPIEVIPRME